MTDITDNICEGDTCSILSQLSLSPSKAENIDLESLSSDDLIRAVFNGDSDECDRISALARLTVVSESLAIECSDKINAMYTFCSTEIITHLLVQIVTTPAIILHIKIQCAQSLYSVNADIGYTALSHISTIMRELPIPLQVEIISTLMTTDKYYTKTLDALVYIVTSYKIECEYRYRMLQSISRNSTNEWDYIPHAYMMFISSTNTYIQYKILAAQYVLQSKTISDERKTMVENICIVFAVDPDLDYDLRADSADMLSRLGSDRAGAIGRDIIMLLGRTLTGISTVYTDRQNVHSASIDDSVSRFILALGSVSIGLNSRGVYYTFNDICSDIQDLIADYPDSTRDGVRDSVRSSLLRISLDSTIYSGGQILSTLFIKIWTIISSHSSVVALKSRMIEELVDMANTCTSGHVSRVVNVLCGFEIDGVVFSIDIGWSQQIRANLIARLTTRIKTLDDEDQMSAILSEMSTSGNIGDKPNLSHFFKLNLLPIRDELYGEFVGGGYINVDLFEEYIRAAISYFEEGV